MQLQEVSPDTRIEWKRCTDIPVSWYRPQIVMSNQKIYVGGGVTADLNNLFTILEYDIQSDTWKLHSQSQVALYGLSHFQGQLITVGGCNFDGVSSNVSIYYQLDKKWKENIQPMPTRRCTPTVISTDTAIIVCGGAVLDDGSLEPLPSKMVEVYNSDTSQWHRSDHLPHPYAAAPFIVIGDYCFLVGEASERDGSRKVSYANMKDLMISSRPPREEEDASNSSNSQVQVWKELPECPLMGSAAVCLNGALLTLGGDDTFEGDVITVNHVHAFVPKTNSWIELKFGALPEALGGSSAAQLKDDRAVIVGGSGPDDENTVSMYIGNIV